MKSEETNKEPPETNEKEKAETKEKTPTTDPKDYEPVKNQSGKRNKDTDEIWEKDKLHKDHYEVYKNKRDYEAGKRDRDVWEDGRSKGKFR